MNNGFNDIDIRRWLVLHTKPRYERKVHWQLVRDQLECYLPLHTVVRHWSDRRKKIEEPLFPGYIFIHTTERERLAALQTYGVTRCVVFNGRAAVVRDVEIQNIRRLLEKPYVLEVYPSLVVGAKVKIVAGPFAGIEGIVTTVRGKRKFAVTVEALSRSVLVEISREELVGGG
jgi:transcription antitermination factor NusG